MFCRSLFVLLYFFFWSLCCLFFFDIRILITPLVSSNSSYLSFRFFQHDDDLIIEKFVLSSDRSSRISYFIGATDIDSEGHCRWLNNENRNYFKFSRSQPNNYDSDFPATYPANCGMLSPRLMNTGIYDDYCCQKRQYIC